MNAPLGERLKTLMVDRHLTLAIAESLTAGNLQVAVGSISGASTFFEGGVTAYSLEQKVRLLSIDGEHAAAVNSVSQRVAFELARGVCTLFRTDLGVGTTGYAEPSPEYGIEVPMAFWGISRRIGGKTIDVVGRQVFGPGLGRVAMQEQVAATALEALVAYLEDAAESA